MGITRQLRQYAGRRMTRRLYRSVPWIGGVLALITVGKAVQRKGLIGGTVDTALDFIPFVGGLKNLVEAGRGRDFIPDKPTGSGQPIETREITR
jgi:Pre-toxin TG